MRDHAFASVPAAFAPNWSPRVTCSSSPSPHPHSDFSNLRSRAGPERVAAPFVPSDVAEAHSNPENAEEIAETISGLKGIALWARTSPRPKR
jgi:hypothetical protein